MRFLVYMYYTHSGYRTSIFGENRTYYIKFLRYDYYCKLSLRLQM